MSNSGHENVVMKMWSQMDVVTKSLVMNGCGHEKGWSQIAK